jgi:hypothetical protein
MVATGPSDMLREYMEEAAKLIPGGITSETQDLTTPEGRAETAKVYREFLLG